MTRILIVVVVVTVVSSTLSAQGSGWLDRLMAVWNQSSILPSAQGATESQAALERRCGSSTLASSVAAEAVRKAGWVPFLLFDRAITRDDVEVIGGMTAASPGCEPATFNLFVFVGRRFAGTLSPIVMTQGRDGVAGAVRVTGPDALTAEFARYTPADAECCPSSRVRVTYRLDRAGTQPTLVALDVRPLR